MQFLMHYMLLHFIWIMHIHFLYTYLSFFLLNLEKVPDIIIALVALNISTCK